MINFLEERSLLAEDYINEMPYYNVGDNENIDLEVEMYNNPSKFFAFLRTVLSGKNFKDKGGQVHKLNNRQIKSLKKLMKEDPYLEVIIKRKLGKENYNTLMHMIKNGN